MMFKYSGETSPKGRILIFGLISVFLIFLDIFSFVGLHDNRNIDVTKKILDILGKPHSLIGVSQDRPGQDKRYGMSFEKLTQRTGWIPHFDFDQALKMTVDWYLKK